MNVLAFSFAAGEFLDEEIESIEEKYGNISFVKDGECIINKSSTHPYQYWAPQESINELNLLIKNNNG